MPQSVPSRDRLSGAEVKFPELHPRPRQDQEAVWETEFWDVTTALWRSTLQQRPTPSKLSLLGGSVLTIISSFESEILTLVPC